MGQHTKAGDDRQAADGERACAPPGPHGAAPAGPGFRDPAAGRRIADFLRLRLSCRLAPRELQRLQAYLVGLARSEARLPARGRGFDLAAIARAAELDPARLEALRAELGPGLRALARELARPRHPRPPRRGRPPAPMEDLPAARSGPWRDPESFRAALRLHMRRHGDSRRGLARWLAAKGAPLDPATLGTWLRGDKAPAHRDSFAALRLLETRWRLAPGYFREKLPSLGRAVTGQRMAAIPDDERRQLAWHLPDDFDRRAPEEQEGILTWVRRVVVQGATDYRRYQALAVRAPYAFRFPAHQAVGPEARLAPPALARDLDDLIAFKRARFTPVGVRRRGVWSAETASHRANHIGLYFGALAAAPEGAVRGFGADPAALTLALLVFPQVWEWLLGWREARRGFLTVSEADMLDFARSLSDPEVGWLTQGPHLAAGLIPLPGLVEAGDVARVRADWRGACAALHSYAEMRRLDVRRLMRIHHDPFEPIRPVLAAEQPLAEYRKIADEVRRFRPCPRLYPKAAAQNDRAYLMVRLGLHLGFRQRNLRELLICPRRSAPRPEGLLADLRRAELRWCEAEGVWEVFAPAAAFKNAGSSFFRGRPYRLRLPDVAGLYAALDAYLGEARPRLLGGAEDPQTLFVKTATRITADAAFSAQRFYGAWRWITARYGVFNPWTGRGAVDGLLPHGPHCVRDVLATHMLKETGSFEQASYAIQSTPETVARHYARFLPQEKAELAARILDGVWR